MAEENGAKLITTHIDRAFRTIEMVGITALLKSVLPPGILRDIGVTIATIAASAFLTMPIAYAAGIKMGGMYDEKKPFLTRYGVAILALLMATLSGGLGWCVNSLADAIQKMAH